MGPLIAVTLAQNPFFSWSAVGIGVSKYDAEPDLLFLCLNLSAFGCCGCWMLRSCSLLLLRLCGFTATGLFFNEAFFEGWSGKKCRSFCIPFPSSGCAHCRKRRYLLYEISIWLRLHFFRWIKLGIRRHLFIEVSGFW